MLDIDQVGLAEGNFRVAQFYYIRGGYRAAGARLIELTTRYPLYSQADEANWMLGQIYEKTEHNEIAALVGCSIGNSKSQLHKARMKLRESLKTSRAEKAAKP